MHLWHKGLDAPDQCNAKFFYVYAQALYAYDFKAFI